MNQDTIQTKQAFIQKVNDIIEAYLEAMIAPSMPAMVCM